MNDVLEYLFLNRLACMYPMQIPSPFPTPYYRLLTPTNTIPTLPCPIPLLLWRPQGSRTLSLLDYESGVLPLHYTSGKASGQVGSEGKEEMLSRRLDLAWKVPERGGHMYGDMVRIRTEVLLLFCHETR